MSSMSSFPTLARRWQRSSGVSGLLLEAARAHPGLPFLEDRFGRVMTYGETADQVRAFCRIPPSFRSGSG